MAKSTSTLPQGQDARQPNIPNPEGENSVATATATATATPTATATATVTATAASSLSTAVDEDGKKRKLQNGDFHTSQYFKIRSIVKDLRPFFVEVSQSPNFRGSKAAHEIKKRMKTMIELTKQLSETASITKQHDVTPAEEPLSRSFEKEQAKEPSDGREQALQPQSELVNLEEFSGPFLVGGSPIGWNFLVFPGSKSVYYGVSKESTLAQRAEKQKFL